MLFVSLVFLFLFLPVTLAIYYLLKGKRKMQNIFLFFVSIIFYAWGEPVFSLMLLFSIALNWGLAFLMAQKPKTKTAMLVVAAVFNIGLLFIYKYLYFSVGQINKFFSANIHIAEIVLPIGIFFFTFQALSYVIDVYRGGDVQRNPINVGLYISFFPQLIAGPIVRYSAIEGQINNRQESGDDFKIGAIRFMQGFSKKVLIANSMASIADKAFSIVGSEQMTVCFAWLGAISYTLQIYFDFSGYSDMAIGLGRMFGFKFDENFNYPYKATSITDFWHRWHISLSSWFRDYVYIPLGGNRCSKARHIMNLFCVWSLTGIWHGANWTFLVWGILYFVFLVIEKYTSLGAFLDKNKAIGQLITLVIVCLLWVIFRADNLNEAVKYISTLFGGEVFYSGMTWVYIRENIVFLIAAIVLSVTSRFRADIDYQSSVKQYIKESTLVLLFIVSIVYVINGTYNPFIYFNF